MNPAGNFPIGTCTFGPVYLSASTAEENKFGIAIIEYDGSRHVNMVVCKTTSKKHDKIYPGEFLLSDLFGHGPTKVQPFNISRIQKASQLPRHTHKGILDNIHLPKFKDGLRIAITRGELDAKEKLDLADSWQHLFAPGA